MINIEKNTALEILERMMLIRETEEGIAARYKEGKMRCPTHLSTGQETIPAVAGIFLRKDDFAVSTHRSHGHYLGKGGNLKRMIAEIYGKAAGCSSGKGGSMHLIDLEAGFMGSTAIVGGTIPVGTGLALSIKLKKTDQISCVFLGDAAVEEGVFYESVNFAVLKKLPVLYLCENNFYSVYSPLGVRQPSGRSICSLTSAIGCKAYDGDGYDVQDVYTKIREAVDYIRTGKGPCLLEFKTYRWREHCGPEDDNSLGYRTDKEYDFWHKRDPVESFKRALIESEFITHDECECLHKKIVSEIKEAFDYAENAAFPGSKELLKDVYR